MQARVESLELLIRELRRSFRELAAAADRELEPMGMQARDRAFLEFLAKETRPISLSDLARKYAVSRQHIHQTLRRLPHPEWVEEVADPADRRAVLLRLSGEGRAQWEKIRDVDRAFLNRLAGRLWEERVRVATDVLRQLRRELLPGKETANEPQNAR